ncbi:MAG: hypothetical protein AAF490_08855 [Chloroflexota bacterium]
MKKIVSIQYLLIFVAMSLLITIGVVQANQANDASESNRFVGGTFISDDFNYCNLASHWTFIDPLGDSTLTLNGTQMLLEVPAGINHDMWEGANTAPRILQTVSNTDFEIEAQFNTTVNSKFQIQGILIQQDDNNKIRFDFFNDGENTNVFYAKFENGVVTDSQATVISSGSELAMQIRRTGDVYSQEYRINSGTWLNHLSITYAGLVVNDVGIFVGNVGTADPAPNFTAAVDYIFNTDSPILPEDNDAFTLNSSVSGPGSLDVSPNKATYNCGETVILTPTANFGAVFTGWGGTLSGHASPQTVNISGDTTVIANFATATDFLYLPMISNVGEISLPASTD